jgi:hypothetical protein
MPLSIMLSGCNGGGDGGSKNGDTAPAEEQSMDISGTWTGSVSGYGETVNITMTIAQAGNNVSGTYVLTNNGDTESGEVTGTCSDGSGSFQFYHEGTPVVTGEFTFEGNNATGTLYYENYSIVINLTRTT